MLLKHFILLAILIIGNLRGFGQYLDKFGPFQFFKNHGQWDKNIQFAISTPDGSYVFNDKGFGIISQKQLEYPQIHSHPNNSFNKPKPEDETIDLFLTQFKLIDASPINWNANHQSTTSYNFLQGEREDWIQDAHTYQVLNSNFIYRGIFARFIGGSGLKYEFIVSPNEDPEQIKLSYEGGEMKINKNGELVFNTGYSKIKEAQPYAYQIINKKKVRISCKYKLQKGILSYKLGKYDKNKELVIDPKLVFSTSAGSTADYWGNTACNDQFGNLYTAGTVFIHTGRFYDFTGLPTTPGAFQSSHQGGLSRNWTDIGVMKFDSSGTNLVYATYLGGNDSEIPTSIVTDETTGELIILGTTGSTNFPMGQLPSYDDTFNGGSLVSPMGGYQFDNGTDIVVIRLNATGTDVVNSTYLGGSGNDGVSKDTSIRTVFNYGDELRGDVIITENGDIAIASITSSPDFMGVNGFNTAYNGGDVDGVVFRLSGDLTTLRWSNTLGGPGSDVIYSVNEFSNGDILVAGGSEGNLVNFPNGGYQSTEAGDVDGFIYRISSDGTSPIASSYLGGPEFDQIYFTQIDDNQNAYVLGQSMSDLPILPSISSIYNNPNNAVFVGRFSPNLDVLHLYTVLGEENPTSKTANFSPTAFLVNECGNVYLSGWGGSTNYLWGHRGDDVRNMPITPYAFKPTTDGSDFYLMAFHEDMTELLFSTYFGGNSAAEHVDGGTSRFNRGIVYQSVCANCGGFQDFPTFPDDGNNNTYPMRNKSDNCNNGVFKYDMANLEADIDGETCLFANEETTFQNLSTGGEDFFWDFGDNSAVITVENTDPITHTYERRGQYTVMVVATDRVTCLGRDTAYLYVNVLDSIKASERGLTCEGDTIQLTVEGATNPEWFPFNYLSCNKCANPFAWPIDTTAYVVKDSLGTNCAIYDTVIIDTRPIPVPRLAFNSTLFRCYTDTIQFTLLSDILICDCCEPLTGISWDFGDGTTSNLNNPKHVYSSEGDYNVILKGYSTDSIFTSRIISPYSLDSCLKNIYIPNAFTPNNDLENDILYVRGINIIELEFRLYNRWGEEVFMTESLKKGWNGYYKGQKQSQQVFVYKCYATFYDGEKVELEGNVTLME